MSGTISGRCPGCPVRNQAMKENLQKNTYSKLVKDITELYRAKSPENATVSPNSQNIAAGGKVELAYNRIHQAPGELNWSQHVELLPVTAHTVRSFAGPSSNNFSIGYRPRVNVSGGGLMI